MKNTLIFGGTSGLGRALAEREVSRGHTVYVTGRHDPGIVGATYLPCELDDTVAAYESKITDVLTSVGTVDRLIYAVGFNQLGLVDEISFTEITQTVGAQLIVPIELLSQLIEKQSRLPELILVTSTSARVPRRTELAYAPAKAGLAHFGRSIALDGRIDKTLVAAPAGMDTKMQWERGTKDKNLLDPVWVAEQIELELAKTDSFREVLILREPPRVEIVE